MFKDLRATKLWDFFRCNAFLIIVSIISFVVVFSPNIQQDIIVGADCKFHLARIETLAHSLKNGIFPVKLHSDLCYGFGYGVGFFYSNFFLYIPAFLINMGLSLEVAYKIFAALLQIGILGSGFFSVFKLTHNKYASLFAAVLYLFSISTLEGFYKLFALGRSTATIFLPLAIVGIYLIITTEKNAELFIIGFCGLIYSHLVSTVLATIACLIIIACCWKKWIYKWIVWKKLICSSVIVLILTAAFWMPLIEQSLSQTYRVSQPWTYVDENVIRLYDLFNNNGIGIILLSIAIFIGLWLSRNWHSDYDKTFYFLGGGFLFITTVPIFWIVTRDILSFIQFPFRLFVMATILLIIAAALWLIRFDMKTTSWEIVISIVLVLSIFQATSYLHDKVNALEDFGDRILYEEIAGLGGGEEWLPVQTAREHLVNTTTAYDDLGNPIEGNKNAGVFYLSVDGKSLYYDVPFVWYKGYSASVNGEDADVVQIEDNGLVRVMINDASSLSEDNRLVVWYNGTILQKISYAINLLGVLCLATWYVICRIKKTALKRTKAK